MIWRVERPIVKVVLVVLAVIACPAVWITVVVPLIARSIGLRFKIGSLPIDRRDGWLGKRHCFWLAGVLGWGVGLSLLGALTSIFIDRTHPSPMLVAGVVSCCFATAMCTQGDWTYPLDDE